MRPPPATDINTAAQPSSDGCNYRPCLHNNSSLRNSPNTPLTTFHNLGSHWILMASTSHRLKVSMLPTCLTVRNGVPLPLTWHWVWSLELSQLCLAVGLGQGNKDLLGSVPVLLLARPGLHDNNSTRSSIPPNSKGQDRSQPT
jgi:hypothetical protein